MSTKKKNRQTARAQFNFSVWKKILPFAKKYYKILSLSALMLFLCAVADVLIPLFQRYAIDNFIIAQDMSTVSAFSAIYIVMIAFQAFAVVVFCRIAITVEMRLGRDMKLAAFRHLQNLSLSYFNTTPVGYIVSRVMSDTSRISEMLAWGIIDFFWSGSFIIGTFIAMLILDYKLALLVMTVVPALALVTVYFQKKLLELNRLIRHQNSQLTGAINEGISGAKTSKTLVVEDKNHADFSSLAGEMYKMSVKHSLFNALYIPTMMFLSSLAVATILVRGGYLVMNDLMLLGTLSAFISYSIGIFEPMQQAARVLSNLISGQANVERFNDLMTTVPNVVDTPEVIEVYGDSFNPKKENWEPIKGRIEFKNVYFKYPDGHENVLERFNLVIPAGATVAIVGETGAGKSTLVNLACRFYEPNRGRILIDDRDYRERSQLWLHSSIGYVLQSPHLFSGSIRENIRYGRLDATDEEVEAAARLVSADAVAGRLPNGFDSDVGEDGDKLSTGEKQLISFARAVLADPKIFVLDEATSSIDTQTEQLIQAAMSKVLGSRTSLLIAHRLSTIKHADFILVVKDGKIIERGSHSELITQRGHYYNLYTKQFELESGEKIFEKR